MATDGVKGERGWTRKQRVRIVAAVIRGAITVQLDGTDNSQWQAEQQVKRTLAYVFDLPNPRELLLGSLETVLRDGFNQPDRFPDWDAVASAWVNEVFPPAAPTNIKKVPAEATA